MPSEEHALDRLPTAVTALYVACLTLIDLRPTALVLSAAQMQSENLAAFMDLRAMIGAIRNVAKAMDGLHDLLRQEDETPEC